MFFSNKKRKLLNITTPHTESGQCTQGHKTAFAHTPHTHNTSKKHIINVNIVCNFFCEFTNRNRRKFIHLYDCLVIQTIIYIYIFFRSVRSIQSWLHSLQLYYYQLLLFFAFLGRKHSFYRNKSIKNNFAKNKYLFPNHKNMPAEYKFIKSNSKILFS